MGIYSGDYYGAAFVGTPVQSPSGNYWAFDTQSDFTVVPLAGGPTNGWFDCSLSTTCVDLG